MKLATVVRGDLEAGFRYRGIERFKLTDISDQKFGYLEIRNAFLQVFAKVVYEPIRPIAVDRQLSQVWRCDRQCQCDFDR